jgi:glutamate racemase
MKALPFVLLALALPAAADPVLDAILRYAEQHPQGDAPFSFNPSRFQETLAHLPIGVFDSGIGGLTVLEEILTVDAFHNETFAPGPDGRPDFEDERFIYFGDQANMPYGNYSAADQTDYLRELILKDALFLLGTRYTIPGLPPRMDKPPVKALVIACNTATAYGLEDLRKMIAALKLPIFVVGVVEAGARGLMNEPEAGAVGVFATVGTCSSGAYPRTIQSTRGLAGRPAAAITQYGSPALAAIIEGDPAFTTPLAEQIQNDLRALVENHRQAPGSPPPLQKIILGCTHFPLALKEIEQAFEALRQAPELAPFIAPHLSYVNPAEWTAKELFRQLASARLRHRPGTARASEQDRFFISVPNPTSPGVRLTDTGALEHDYKYGRSPGQLTVEDTLNVPLTLDQLSPTSRNLILTKLPKVAQRLAMTAP